MRSEHSGGRAERGCDSNQSANVLAINHLVGNNQQNVFARGNGVVANIFQPRSGPAYARCQYPCVEN